MQNLPVVSAPRRVPVTIEEKAERRRESLRFWWRSSVTGIGFVVVSIILGGVGLQLIINQTKVSQAETVQALKTQPPKAPLTLDQAGTTITQTDKCVMISGKGSQQTNWVLWSAFQPQEGTDAAFVPAALDANWIDASHWSVHDLSVGPNTTDGTQTFTLKVFYLPATTSATLMNAGGATDGSDQSGFPAHAWLTLHQIPLDATDVRTVQVKRNGGNVNVCD
jgi:hypothetical protein